MIENLMNIDGPTFLLIYFLYAIIVIVLSNLAAGKDLTRKLVVPEPSEMDAYDLAILSKGVKGAINLALFNLWKKKAISITEEGKSIILKQEKTDTSKLHKLEKAIYEYVLKQKYLNELFSGKNVKSLEMNLLTNFQRLRDLHLDSESGVKKQNWVCFSVGTLFLLFFGISKASIGAAEGKPIGFLIVLMILSIVILFFVVKPYKDKTTALGKKLLKKSEERFAWTKYSKVNTPLLNDEVLVYGVAVFGFSALNGKALADDLEIPIMFEKYSSQGTSYNGNGCAGCGGDIGSDNGGCGGNGCSGCSGGGCGGCGGCGGS